MAGGKHILSREDDAKKSVLFFLVPFQNNQAVYLRSTLEFFLLIISSLFSPSSFPVALITCLVPFLLPYRVSKSLRQTSLFLTMLVAFIAVCSLYAE